MERWQKRYAPMYSSRTHSYIVNQVRILDAPTTKRGKMKWKSTGGALLMAGIYEDFKENLIDENTANRRVSIIVMYEAGEVTLQELNEIW